MRKTRELPVYVLGCGDMFDLHSAFESLQLDNDILESSIDPDFITRFLLPYFQDMPREQLEAKLAEIVALEKVRAAAAFRRR